MFVCCLFVVVVGGGGSGGVGVGRRLTIFCFLLLVGGISGVVAGAAAGVVAHI